MVEVAGDEEHELAAEMAAAFLSEQLPESNFGAPKAGTGMWASIVRIINPNDGRTLHQIHLEQNEAAFRSVFPAYLPLEHSILLVIIIRR